MARYQSNDQQNLRVGISSFSEDKTSLVVIGKVGVGTDDAMDTLHVQGDAFISGSIGIGTTNANSAVMADLDTIINVGIVTANEIYGEFKGSTGIVTTAAAISGVSTGQLLVQTAEDTTTFLDYGSTGQVLTSAGDNNPPNWVAAAPSGAIEGILLFEEGAAVGLGTTYSGLDFRGSNITIDGTSAGFIATLTSNGDFGTQIISGAGLSVTGVVTATSFEGDGSQLTGVSAGFWEQTSAGINTLSNVGIGTTNPTVALDVHGDVNITGDLTVEGNSIPTIAMIVALGGF